MRSTRLDLKSKLRSVTFVAPRFNISDTCWCVLAFKLIPAESVLLLTLVCQFRSRKCKGVLVCKTTTVGLFRIWDKSRPIFANSCLLRTSSWQKFRPRFSCYWRTRVHKHYFCVSRILCKAVCPSHASDSGLGAVYYQIKSSWIEQLIAFAKLCWKRTKMDCNVTRVFGYRLG